MKVRGKHIHFMGVGGIGVSALAGICLSRGAIVSGCDREVNEQTRLIESLGGTIFAGHCPEHLEGVDKVVYSSAINKLDAELQTAGDRAVRRGNFLAELLKEYRAAGVCGTHGKTTTSWMLSHILISCGLNPTVVLGGRVRALGGNFRVGSDLCVCELDESDGSFLEPQLRLALITNIESEHLSYYGSLEKVVQSFAHFSDNSNGPDILVACLDDPVAAGLYEKRTRRKVGYGLIDRRGYHAEIEQADYGGQKCRIYSAERFLGSLTLPYPGKHNILNALGALAASVELGADAVKAIEALSECPPVGRRMEFLGEHDGMEVYSDYAHHPTEVAAAISAARELLGDEGRLLVAFQPHLYSRTRDYYREFAQALGSADGILLTDIYAAREEPIAGVSSELIFRELVAMGKSVTAQVTVDELNALVKNSSLEYELVVYMGAGDIDKIAREFMKG